jgi:hypothetical protein
LWPWSYCSWIYNYLRITTDQGEVYNINVIKFVSDLR